LFFELLFLRYQAKGQERKPLTTISVSE